MIATMPKIRVRIENDFLPDLKVCVLSFKELSYRVAEYCTFLFNPHSPTEIYLGKCGAVNTKEKVEEKFWCINPKYLSDFPTFKKVWPKILRNLQEADIIVITQDNYSVLIEELTIVYKEYVIPFPQDRKNYNIFFMDCDNPMLNSPISICNLAEKLEISTKETPNFCKLVRENRYSPCFIRDSKCYSIRNIISGEEFIANALLEALVVKRLFNKLLEDERFKQVVEEKSRKRNPFRDLKF